MESGPEALRAARPRSTVTHGGAFSHVHAPARVVPPVRSDPRLREREPQLGQRRRDRERRQHQR